MIVRIFFSAIFIFLAPTLFAVPLESGYSLAPRAAASEDEKANAYMLARRLVIEAAQKYIGTPYIYGGMTSNGLDCSGFICLSFYDALGISLPRSAAGIYAWTAEIPLENAQPGDFLFFKTDTANSVNHVGLYLGGGRFIHSASAGLQTGVIYSSLNESYWVGAFAGAGRAFPEIPGNFSASGGSSIAGNNPASIPVIAAPQDTDASLRETSADIPPNVNNRSPSSSGAGETNGRFLVSAAIAPIWNGFFKGGALFRGFTSQICFYSDTYFFGPRNIFGFEIRPEYDSALGVFRLPVTLSWGPDEKIRVFLGPVFSFGDAEQTEGETGGVRMLCAIGVTASPFVISSAAGDFAPYAEIAWQTNLLSNEKIDLAADFSAGFRFSTGIRWMLQVR